MHVEEKFNAYSHLLSAALALVGTVVLVTIAARLGDPWRIGSFAIYGAALIAQYVTSFLYHSASGPAKPMLRNLDHCAIYLLIAGTYSPFTLVTLRGKWGWPLFAAIWVLAIVGILQEIRLPNRSRVLSLAIYLLMGWLAVLAIVPAYEQDPEPNRFGLIQAITRAAQALRPEDRLTVEEFAGRIASMAPMPEVAF